MNLGDPSAEKSKVLPHQQDSAVARRIWETEYVQYLLEQSKWLCEELDSGRVQFQQICQRQSTRKENAVTKSNTCHESLFNLAELA